MGLPIQPTSIAAWSPQRRSPRFGPQGDTVRRKGTVRSAEQPDRCWGAA